MQKQNRNRTLVILSVAALVVAGVCLAGAIIGGAAYFSGDGNPIATAKTFFTQEIRQAQEINLDELPETPLNADIDLKRLFSPFWESRQLLHDNYVDQPIDDDQLANGAVDGLTPIPVTVRTGPGRYPYPCGCTRRTNAGCTGRCTRGSFGSLPTFLGAMACGGLPAAGR